MKMKKLLMFVLALLLLLLCACTRMTREDAMQRIQDSWDEAQMSAQEEAPVSFAAVEEAPSLSEPQGGDVSAEALHFLHTRQYGPITANYYALSPELTIWDARQAVVGAACESPTPGMELPGDLGFAPFRTYSNLSSTRLLICRLEDSAPAAQSRYYLYDGESVREVEALNERLKRAVLPPYVRWRGDDVLAFDVEDPGTGKWTTYGYDVLTGKEEVLLADYDPFPFDAGDTAKERCLLIDDAYVLRVVRGGAVYLRRLDAAEGIQIPDLQTPDAAYFHITRLNSSTAVYFDADETGRLTTLAFIDLVSGSCAKLSLRVPDSLDAQYPILWDDSSIAIPVNSNAADENQNDVFVYSFDPDALLAVEAPEKAAENAAKTPDEAQIDETLLTDEALIQLVLGPEIALTKDNSFTFSDPTELSSQELYMLFLYFGGYDTFVRDCQDAESGEFLFTEAYISALLSRYFKDFSLDITQINGYDAARNAVVSKNPSGFGGDRNPKLTEKKVDGNIVTFTVAYYAWEDFAQTQMLYAKTYQVEFYDGGVYYLSAG